MCCSCFAYVLLTCCLRVAYVLSKNLKQLECHQLLSIGAYHQLTAGRLLVACANYNYYYNYYLMVAAQEPNGTAAGGTLQGRTGEGRVAIAAGCALQPSVLCS